MNARFETPVLLLFFNRPAHAAAVLDRVRLVKPSRLYVHCDGARQHVNGEPDKVMEVRELIRTIDWDCQVTTLFREENKGLRLGVSSALDWFFEQEEMGVILEDDCLPDVSFFGFCETLLIRYRNDQKIMHIAGSNLAENQSAHFIESYFFSKFAFVWGWASWRRAWKNMSLQLEGFDTFKAQNRINEFTGNTMAQAYLLDKFEVTRQKRNNSWAYAWFYSILNADGLTIVPAKNLVQNTGIGESGATHTNKKDDRAAIKASEIHFPLIHPKAHQRTPGMDQQLFYLTQKSRLRLVLWYLLKKSGLR